MPGTHAVPGAHAVPGTHVVPGAHSVRPYDGKRADDIPTNQDNKCDTTLKITIVVRFDCVNMITHGQARIS